MKAGLKTTLLLLFLSCHAAMGESRPADAIQETATVIQNIAKPWKTGDSICVPAEEGQSRCGRVIAVNGTQVVVQLNLLTRGMELIPDDTGAQMKKKVSQPTQKPKERRTASIRKTGKAKRQLPVAKHETIPNEDLKSEIVPAKEPAPPVTVPVIAPVVAPVIEHPAADAATERIEPTHVKPQVLPEPEIEAEPPPPPVRKTASINESVTAVSQDWNLAAGFGVGTSYLFPMIHVERKLASWDALGIMPLYASGNGISVAGIPDQHYWTGSRRFSWFRHRIRHRILFHR